MFAHVTACGTPYEVGLAHGRQAARQVAACVDTYRAMFMDYSGITWEQAQRYAAGFADVIAEYEPSCLDELRGVAAGSGFSFEEILALNTRSEIVLQGGQVAPSSALTGGCTAFAFEPMATRCGHTLLLQNWDWKSSIRDACILLEIEQAGRPRIRMVTEAGIIGKVGMNSAGIGVCLNALGSDDPAPGKRVPLHIALRHVLDARTLDEAIANAVTMPLACCAHFLIASAEGRAVSVELGPAGHAIIEAQNGRIAHTNHFIAPEFSGVHDTLLESLPDSPVRLARIRELLAEQGPGVDLPQLEALLRDHESSPSSICRHEDETQPAAKRMCTIFGLAMDLNAARMRVACGNPCENEFEDV